MCSGHGKCIFDENNSGTKCICDENWSGFFCATGPDNLLLYSCGISPLSADISKEAQYVKNFTRIAFPFSQVNEQTKIKFFRTNGNFFSFILDDYVHIGGINHNLDSGNDGKDVQKSFGSNQVLLFFFFSF